MTLNLTGPDVTRPLLRYHGGKWRLAPWVITHLPQHVRYVEPFGGSMGVLLRKPRSQAEVYNDLDGEVVNLFRVVRERPVDLARALELTPYSRDEFGAAYESSEDSLERARRLLIRSLDGVRLTRSDELAPDRIPNDHGRHGDLPATPWATLPPVVREVAERLRGVVIENRPALQVIAQYDAPSTLFYVDPPYVFATRDRVTQGRYYRHELTDEDHSVLARTLSAARGMVVLSGYRSDLYRELFSAEWSTVETHALADGAEPRTEALWLNAAAWAAQGHGTLFNRAVP